MPDLTSRPYKPDPEKCCERCAFGRGNHAIWCAETQLNDKIRQSEADHKAVCTHWRASIGPLPAWFSGTTAP